MRLFSYPEGQQTDYDETVIGVLKDLNLKHAPSAIAGTNRLLETDPFALRRRMVGFEALLFPFNPSDGITMLLWCRHRSKTRVHR